jgi:HD superfamily phosphohydrolase
MYTSIYTDDIPVLLEQLAHTSEMRRLSDIGMHCGCEYAKFPFYQMERTPYTRLIHSVGVSKIVWNFTHDIRQAIAGLLHDIATPVFAHTIDFLQGDHLTQESTEDKTLSFIESSREITDLLKLHHIRIEDVSDYHIYPIADNDTPMLSADRLEYTIGNGFCLYNMELKTLNGIYQDLTVTQNEHGIEELCFQSVDAAKKFTEISLRNSRFFVSDEDRFSMQYLADIIRVAVDDGILVPSDLYLTEKEVIKILKQDKKLSKMWKGYTDISAVETSAEKLENQYCVNVSAKKRYIDPLVIMGNTTKRLTEIDIDIQDQIHIFLNSDFNKWIYTI